MSRADMALDLLIHPTAPESLIPKSPSEVLPLTPWISRTFSASHSASQIKPSPRRIDDICYQPVCSAHTRYIVNIYRHVRPPRFRGYPCFLFYHSAGFFGLRFFPVSAGFFFIQHQSSSSTHTEIGLFPPAY